MNNKLKLSLKYIIPSLATMFAISLYTVIDGMFVGQGVGANALASVNVALPFTMVAMILGTLFTIGSTTVFAIRVGRGDNEGATDVFLHGFLLVLIATGVLTVLGLVMPEQIARVCGASDVLLSETATYIRYYSIFTIPSCMGQFFAGYVRNDGNPTLSFWGMLAGAATNIFLDWLFIFPFGMGVMGAAVATGIAQTLSMLIIGSHFMRKRGIIRFRRFHVKKALIGKVCKRGIPEAIAQMNMPLTILCYNLVIMRFLGEAGLTAFSIVSYMASLVISMAFGSAEALQPLIGNSFGAGNRQDEKYFLGTGLKFNVGMTLAVYVLLLIFGQGIGSLFNGDQAIVSTAYHALTIYGFSLVLASVSIMITTYFFSTKRTTNANVIAALRSVVLNTLCITLLPNLFGEGILWHSIVVAEAAAAVISIVLLVRSRKREDMTHKSTLKNMQTQGQER